MLWGWYNKKGNKEMKNKNTRRGFTLIELLVVVLIIGILAAVALPQYQLAVKKAKITRVIPLVQALVTAEEVYYLGNGEYTNNLSNLDIEMPKDDSCKIKQDRYDCSQYTIGVFNEKTNAQGGDKEIRYLVFFDDYNDVYTANKGDRICLADDEISRKVCNTLGAGKEDTTYSGSWAYMYRFD